MKNKLKKIIVNLIPDYKSMINNKNNTVLCSYVNDGFLLNKNSRSLLTHGNKIEAIMIKEVFNELGFNFVSIRYDKEINLKKYDKLNPKIIFGLEPNFEKLCKRYPQAIKIYYATGCYVKHQNNMVKTRTDYINREKKCNIPYYRTVPENNAAKIADYIIQIGSKYTIETYPQELKNKVIIIRQSSFEFLNLDIKNKKKYYDKKKYLWFGSNGSILKGLDLVLEYFKNNNQYELNIIGPIDKEFKIVYEEELTRYSNIKYHGYIPVYDPKILEIANECTFIIYPSASEGMPGSVINMMRLGLIPITSKYASFNEIDNHGLVLNDLTLESIDKSVKKCNLLTDKKINDLFEKNYRYASENYNIKTFKNDFNNAIASIIKENDIK